MNRPITAICLLCSASFFGGCGFKTFDSSVPPTLEEIQAVVSDSDLSAEQKRVRLMEMGLTPVVINGILRSERTGNQFGGDLRTAYEKVVGSALKDMTPDEIQIYGDAATDTGAGTFDFTDEQAQATANLFASANIKSSADLDAFLINNANQLPPEVPTTLRPLFIDFDPDMVLNQLP